MDCCSMIHKGVTSMWLTIPRLWTNSLWRILFYNFKPHGIESEETRTSGIRAKYFERRSYVIDTAMCLCMYVFMFIYTRSLTSAGKCVCVLRAQDICGEETTLKTALKPPTQPRPQDICSAVWVSRLLRFLATYRKTEFVVPSKSRFPTMQSGTYYHSFFY